MQELDSQRGEGAYFRGNTVHVISGSWFVPTWVTIYIPA